ncbi:MAG: DUF4157 domain-containing protein [Geobacter sp.]|nr:DUF4157 domain-containing protein [Geobacter sp.]
MLEHAALVTSISGRRPVQAARLMCALQHDFGNRYVRRVLALSGQGTGKTDVTPEVETGIQTARGGGQALDGTVRSRMEPAFNADFSNVRVHTGGKADGLNRALSARAFTTGQDIFFKEGEYNPASSTGQELLAHELTHVVQQGGGVQGKFEVSSPDDEQEREADVTARSVVATMTDSQQLQGPTAEHGAAQARQSSPKALPAATASRKLQRRMVATGDPRGFATLANSIIAVQYEVVVTAAGVVSHGTTSTRASDRNVIAGNYTLSRVDLDDLAMAGGSAGRGLTAGTWLAHEIQEQYRKQAHSEGYPAAHAAGLATEERASGATITPGTMTQINATTIQWTDTYTYPDGTREAVTVTVTNGNITNVSRRALP